MGTFSLALKTWIVFGLLTIAAAQDAMEKMEDNGIDRSLLAKSSKKSPPKKTPPKKLSPKKSSPKKSLAKKPSPKTLTIKSAKLLDLTNLKWGLGTSAYQVEGGASAGGRGPSIWDAYAKKSGKIVDGTSGDVASNSYALYKQDVKILDSLKVTYYRFSISWSRLIKDAGSAKQSVNPAGVAYYNNLINELVAKGIQPMVTLYHWDLPLNNDIKEAFWIGLDSKKTTAAFLFYANAAFKAFGDRVKAWSTFNEPWTFVMLGYGWGVHAPGINSPALGVWRAGHNVLLAHAAAVQLYRKTYKPKQHGRIGINLNCDWAEPFSSSAADRQAAQWSTEFRLGWFADPVYKGDYPASMRQLLGNRLPEFTAAEKKMLKGSTDYFALNHYTSFYAKAMTEARYPWTVQYWETTPWGGPTGVIGESSASNWLKVVPWGFRKLLVWIKNRYNNPEIWVTENGVSMPGEATMSTQNAVNDGFRVEFYRKYLTAMQQAITVDQVRVTTYVGWSLVDNFEWTAGFTERFGVVRVDLTGKNYERHIKKSAWFLKDVFVNGNATKA